jgi:haloalkane dehalogenase
MAWRNFAERNPDLPIGFVIQGATATEVPQEIIDAYEAPWPNAEAKAGPAQFPLIVPIEATAPGAAEMTTARERLGEWDRPALVCFSDSDPIFTPKAGQRFVDLIPGARDLVVIEGAAHFLQEDKGERIAGEINSFLEDAGGA